MDTVTLAAPSELYQKHQAAIEKAIRAVHTRDFYAYYPEHPSVKNYGETAQQEGRNAFEAQLHHNFTLAQEGDSSLLAEEISPYTLENLGITYPRNAHPEDYAKLGKRAFLKWQKLPLETRAAFLMEIVENLKARFFELAYATMHTSGQSFAMAFQASGPHAIDRAVEAIALGMYEQQRFPESVDWVKNMGANTVEIRKTYKNVAKGVGLCIGCSTFPVWNTIPAIFANLITGNAVIVKPHPKAIYPIAIVVQEFQNLFKKYKIDVHTVMLACDTVKHPITKKLAELPDIQIIDYTGSTSFGQYIESIPNKIIFTEKAGVNCVILDSVDDWQKVLDNLAFSVCLYSGQMCTSPQNFLIPLEGILVNGKRISHEQAMQDIANAILNFAQDEKKGYVTLGAMQCDATCLRVEKAVEMGATVYRSISKITNPEFPKARVVSPAILEVPFDRADVYEKELFGPILLFIPTYHTAHSVQIAKDLAMTHGSISCAAYTTNEEKMELIAEEMSWAATSVSFNFTGAFWVNQNAGFSDFHLTGGNPAGNASLVNPEYIRRRYTMVGMRYKL
ncbi:MAG: aldehyde dehydrogenase family protein [Bacteroidia bacterium]